jgi:hypothetical protein
MQLGAGLSDNDSMPSPLEPRKLPPRGPVIASRILPLDAPQGEFSALAGTPLGKAVLAVRDELTDELRKPEYRGHPNPIVGHCYAASEAVFHLVGGECSNWRPRFIRHEGAPHWFLQEGVSGKVCDPTADQFKTPVPYEDARAVGFLTGYERPSKRAQVLMDRVRDADR